MDINWAISTFLFFFDFQEMDYFNKNPHRGVQEISKRHGKLQHELWEEQFPVHLFIWEEDSQIWTPE